MMRRHSAPAAAAATTAAGAARCIAAFNFGHPKLDTEFLPADHFPKRSTATDEPVRVSKLPNGMRVVTHNRHGPQVTVGAYFEGGAKFDPATAPGLSYVLRWALSGSNMENSLFQIDRALRAHGAAREHTEINKRLIGLKVETMAGSHWEKLAQDLFTSIAVPRFPEYDTERFRDTMDNIREELRWNRPREYAVDELETVAFYREALGNPRYVPPEHNSTASHGALIAQWATLCVPSKVIIAAVNVDHDAVVAAYENAPFPHSASSPHHAKSKAGLALPATPERDQYTAGADRFEYENRAKAMATKPNMDEEAIVALGFLSVGGENQRAPLAASMVAREIAAQRFGEALALDRHELTAEGVQSFYRPYTDVGLLGATVRCAPSETKALVTEAASVLKGVAGVTETELTAAKARAVARFYTDNLEVGRDYVDYLAASLTGEGMHRTPLDETLKAINSVDTAAVKNATANFASARPVMFATGECLNLPSLRQLGL